MESIGYIRNRVRAWISAQLRFTRELQLIAGIPSSQILRLLATVFRETGEGRVAVYLMYVVRELEQNEINDVRPSWFE